MKKPRIRKEEPFWNKLDVKLELFISPELKMRYGLPQKTTQEAIEEQKKLQGKEAHDEAS